MGTFIPPCHIYSMNTNKHKGNTMIDSKTYTKNKLEQLENRNKKTFNMTYEILDSLLFNPTEKELYILQDEIKAMHNIILDEMDKRFGKESTKGIY